MRMCVHCTFLSNFPIFWEGCKNGQVERLECGEVTCGPVKDFAVNLYLVLLYRFQFSFQYFPPLFFLFCCFCVIFHLRMKEGEESAKKRLQTLLPLNKSKIYLSQI